MPANFAGRRVAAFESRRAADMASLIERAGGVPLVCPSMREVGVDRNGPAIDFARQIIAGRFDAVVFMTGVGVRHLLAEIEPEVDRAAFLKALAAVTTIARGPKPVAVLKEHGLAPTHRVHEPNTWRELLETIDRECPVAGRRVGVQEYGIPQPNLTAGLIARGAEVISVKVYDWDFPTDTGPLEAGVRALAAGDVAVALFTSSRQVIHVLAMAERLHLREALSAAWPRIVVASIGPTTSETLRDQGLPVDLEPEHPKMGHLIQAAAERCGELLAKKNAGEGVKVNESRMNPVATNAADSLFMRACRREPVERTPIWLMRQAGRYLPEYRAIREKTTFLELCKDPGLCAEVMIRTVERLGVDAAIIFSDLLPILEPMGLRLEFTAGEGPVIHNPVRAAADIDRVLELDSLAALDFVMETVRQTRAGIAANIPVLGFAGAPFTLASYVIEGGASRNYLHTKSLMYRDEGAWHALMGRLARAVGRYLLGQIAGGAQAVQLFDSWAGCLGSEDYRRYVLPHTKAVIDAVGTAAPVINFATGNPALLPLLTQAGGQVIGVDWRIDLDEAWRVVGHDRAVQGNLDPVVLLAEPAEIRRRARCVLEQAAGRPGHIFNLGHGVLPQTPPAHVDALIAAVRDYRG